jgi:TonB family protein
MGAKVGVISAMRFATRFATKKGVVIRAAALVACCVLCQCMAFSQAASPTVKVISADKVKERLERNYTPVYPAEAKSAHIEGAVVLHTLIATDGSVKSVKLVSGPPKLVQAAEDAVKQWKYQPYLVNGNPVPVATQVTVDFKLDDPPAAPEKPKATVLECDLPAAPTSETPFPTIATYKGKTEPINTMSWPGGLWQQPLTFLFHSDDPQWQHNDVEYFITQNGYVIDVGPFSSTVPPLFADHSGADPIWVKDKSYFVTVKISRTSMAVTQTLWANRVTSGSDVIITTSGTIQRTGQCQVYAPAF